LNPQVVANVINFNQQFLTELLGYLDVEGTARAVNENAAWASTLVGLLNPQVIANVMNSTGSKTTQLINKLSGSVVGYIVNHNGPFITGLVGGLTPTVLTDALNTTAGRALIADMIGDGGLNPRVIAEVTNQAPDFTKGLLQPLANGGLDPQLVVEVVHNNQAFIQQLIGYLHADVINQAVKNSTILSYPTSAGGPKGALYDLIGPGGLNPAVVAGLLNNNATFLGNLLGGMDPSATASILDSVNGRDFIGKVVKDLTDNPANLELITNALADSNAIETTRKVLLSLADPAAVSFLVAQLNLAGLGNPLAGITVKLLDNLTMGGLITSRYMYNTFVGYKVEDAPVPWDPAAWGR